MSSTMDLIAKLQTSTVKLREREREQKTCAKPASTPMDAPAPPRSRNTAQKSSVLDDQDLVDVMLQLEYFEDPCAKHIFSMANRGDLYPLHEETLAPLRLKKANVFDKDIFDTPWLSGQENLPFDFLPTVSEIQNALIKDIGGQNSFRFAPSLGSPEQDEQTTLKLLKNIQSPAFNERGAIIHMSSPTFDEYRTKSLPWTNDGILAQSRCKVTVAPAGEVFDLEFSAHHYFSTLLTGTKVWVAYPPQHGNSVVLQRRYESLAGNRAGPVFLSIVKDLKHGIAIIQKEGQTLMLPPFWSYLSIYISASTLCSYHLASTLKYTMRLLSIDLQVSAILLWPEKAQQQTELINYIESLMTHFDLILNSTFPKSAAKSDLTIKEICGMWDKPLLHFPERGSLKSQIIRLCKLIADPEKQEDIEGMWQQAWLNFLHDRRKKKPECRICHVKIRDMPTHAGQLQGIDAPDAIMMAHFVLTHWNAVD